jgi:hypothetical protein
MKYSRGLVLSEVVTYTMLIIIGAAVAYGFFVSHQRDQAVTMAKASIVEIQAAVLHAESQGMAVVCSNELVSADVLENDYLPLAIKPMMIYEGDFQAGYAPGVFIESKREENGNDHFVSAERLQAALMEPGKGTNAEGAEPAYVVRLSAQTEDEIAYGVLLSDTATCTDSLASNTAP